MPSPSNPWSARTLLLIATGLVLASIFIPYGYLLTYPFQLFGTFIHETGHAFAAVISGGSVLGMQVNLDTSGLAMTQGGSRVLISSAGYLGSIIVGAAFLLAGRRRKWARPTLLVAGAGTLMATAFFGGYGHSLLAFLVFAVGMAVAYLGNVRAKKGGGQAKYLATGGVIALAALVYIGLTGGLLTWAVGLLMGGALLLMAAYGKPLLQHLTVIFLGVQVAFDGLNSVKVLFNLTTNGHDHSDAVNMANATGIPATFWAVLWGVMGLAIVAGAFWLFWREEHRSPKKA